jgi:hypothetical protein
MEMNEKFFYDPYEEKIICSGCKRLIENGRYGIYYCNVCQVFIINGYVVVNNKISNQLTKG